MKIPRLLFLVALLAVFACGTRDPADSDKEDARPTSGTAARTLVSRATVSLPFRGPLSDLPGAVSILSSWMLEKGYFHAGPPFLLLDQVPEKLADGEVSGILHFPRLAQKGNSSGAPVTPTKVDAVEGEAQGGSFHSLSWEGPLADIDKALRLLRQGAAAGNRRLEGRFMLEFTDTLQDEEKRGLRLMAEFRTEQQ